MRHNNVCVGFYGRNVAMITETVMLHLGFKLEKLHVKGHTIPSIYRTSAHLLAYKYKVYKRHADFITKLAITCLILNQLNENWFVRKHRKLKVLLVTGCNQINKQDRFH